MNKLSRILKQFVLVVGALLFLEAQSAYAEQKFDHSPEQAKELVAERSKTVVTALSQFDMVTLSRYTHPERGLKFYPYLASEASQQRTPEMVRQFMQDSETYAWGSYDGTGEPILLTSKEYYRKFIYDTNFSQAKEINYNTFKQRGNTKNLLPEKHPHAIFVEYFRPGHPNHEMEWKGLWLVWEKADDDWYLVAFGHDQWTI